MENQVSSLKKLATPLWTLLLAAVILFASCKPDPPIPPDPQPGTFQLEFAPTWGTNPLVLSQQYLAANLQNYQIDVLKFYVSRIALLTPSDSVVNVKDVALVDLYTPASKTISGSVPAGSYTGLRFNLGLDYALNHSNQSSYPTTHPLSTVTGMYWTWATQYIFSMIEGRTDTSGGNPDTIFIYHSGSDSLLRPLEFRNLNIVIGESGTQKHTISLDMQKVFWSAQDTIDVIADPSTHTTDNPGLASRVINQLARAMQ
jgi:hypothetical protein